MFSLQWQSAECGLKDGKKFMRAAAIWTIMAGAVIGTFSIGYHTGVL